MQRDLITYNFMCEMDRCEKGTEKETETINTFMNMYVPSTVNKPLKNLQNSVEVTEPEYTKILWEILTSPSLLQLHKFTQKNI